MIDSVECALSMLSDCCSSVFSLISTTLLFSFNLSFFIGQLIVKLGVAVVSILIESVSVLKTLFQVLTEDSFVFLSDIGATVSLLYRIAFDSGDLLIHSLQRIYALFGHSVQSIGNSVINVVLELVNLISCILETFHYCLVLIKNSLVLVGLTSWDLFVFLPNLVIALKRELISFMVLSMAGLRDAVFFLRLKVYHGLQEAIHFVSDIPRESLYGLFVCLVLGYLLIKYHQSIQPLLVRNVAYVFSQCQKTLIASWTYLEAFTFWLLTNETTPSMNRTPHSDAATGINPPADTNNSGGAVENEELHEGNLTVEASVGPSDRKVTQDLSHEERLCVVCQDSERCTIILPCRHVCLCYECCLTIKRTHARCPICRHVVRRTMRVFII